MRVYTSAPLVWTTPAAASGSDTPAGEGGYHWLLVIRLCTRTLQEGGGYHWLLVILRVSLVTGDFKTCSRERFGYTRMGTWLLVILRLSLVTGDFTCSRERFGHTRSCLGSGRCRNGMRSNSLIMLTRKSILAFFGKHPGGKSADGRGEKDTGKEGEKRGGEKKGGKEGRTEGRRKDGGKEGMKRRD